MRLSKILKLKLLFVLTLLLCSCTKDNYWQERKEVNKLSIKLAKENFEKNATELALASFFGSIPQTKSNEENIVPLWKKSIYSVGRNVGEEIVMIPLNLSNDIIGKFNIRFGAYKTFFHNDLQVQSYLVVKKLKNGEITRFITTSIGCIDSKHKKDKPHLYTGNREHYNGFFIISDESGNILKSRLYFSGRSIDLFYRDTPGESEYLSVHKNFENFSIGFSLMSHSRSLTKGGGDSGYITGEGEEYCYNCHQLVNFNYLNLQQGVTILVCSNCGFPPEEIGGGEFYYFCPECGKIEQMCSCSVGGNDVFDDMDDRCLECGRINCDGNCGGGLGGNDGGTPSGNFWTILVQQIIEIVDKQKYLYGCSYNAISFIWSLLGENFDDDSVMNQFIDFLSKQNIDTFTIQDLQSETGENLPSLDLLYNFIKSLFLTDTQSLNAQNIDENHIFVALVKNQDKFGNDIAHMIVIIEIGDGGFTYYDPGVGEILFAHHSDFNVYNPLRVTITK